MKFKKIALAGFAATAVVGLASCKKDKTVNIIKTDDGVITIPDGWTAPDEAPFTGDINNPADVYNYVMGDYMEYYNNALQATSASDRYYWFAKAEAEMLNQAVLIPIHTDGGRYGFTRAAYGSAPFCYWGNEPDRLDQLVLATDLVKKEDRETMKAKWQAERNKVAGYSTISDGTHKSAYDPLKELTALGYTQRKNYTSGLSTWPETFDIANTYQSSDSQHLVNFMDYLIGYDNVGYITPAIATSWETSSDGLTWTFHLRDDVKWVKATGEEYATVTASDFVYGVQRCGELGATSYMLSVLENADEWMNGEKQFTDVGVKAVDNQTLQFKLKEKTDYFLTYLTYNSFAPINKAFVEEQGENYGVDRTNILYCGPFICSENTPGSSLKYVKNTKYYNADKVTLDEVIYVYEDGSNPTEVYNKAKDGTYIGASLSEVTLPLAKADGTFDTYGYVGSTDYGMTYFMGLNVNRTSYHSAYAGEVNSAKTTAQRELAKKAMLNANFRRALVYAFDKVSYLTPSTGADCARLAIRNTYTPYNFVSTSAATHGYKANTPYGDMVLGEMQAAGALVTNLTDGVNAYYKPELAKLYLEKALEELGITETIYLDWPNLAISPVMSAQSAKLKSSIELALGKDKVTINFLDCSTPDSYYSCNYYAEMFSDGGMPNYDLDASSGWGPDYGDPQSFLATMTTSGDMIHITGIAAQ